MSMGFSFVAARSRLLAKNEYEAMLATAEVLEQDAHGIKVLRLQNGDMLKIFRVKRLLSSARLYSYARRFCRNAKRLDELGIPTVSIKALYHFSSSLNTAVLYAPLPGMTLRELSRNHALDQGLMKKLGRFVAVLHELGIYFRSLHLGNIVLTPDGRLGLIDVADMRVFSRELSCSERLRNFYHMNRLEEDRESFGSNGWQTLQKSYFAHCDMSVSCTRKLQSALIEFNHSDKIN